MSSIEPEPSGKSKVSFQVGADILILLLLYSVFMLPCVINT